MTSPKTLKRCMAEAKEFIRCASEVQITQNGNHEYIDAGKASGLMKAQSLILTRALADLRQGR